MTPLWQVIFKKEIMEVFRDGRTRFNTILSPLLITPIVLGLIGTMTRSQMEASLKETIPVAFVGVQQSHTLSDVLKTSLKEPASGDPDEPRLKVTDAATAAEAETLVRDHKVRAALVFPTDAQAMLDESRQVAVTVLCDQGKQSSTEAAGRLEGFVRKRGARLVALRLQENGLPQQLATPFATKQENIKGGTTSGTLIATMLLPYILAISAIIGGVYVANDTVAGEKERGTLETLLVSPASRREIVTGKFFTVAAVSMISGVLSIVGFLWPFYTHIKAFEWMGKSHLVLTSGGIAAMLLVQVPLAVLGAGLLLSVSTFARNQREAQSYLSPVILFGTFAAMLSLFLKSDAPLFWAAVPITNAALVLKQALEGLVNPAFVVVACVMSLLYAAAAVAFAAYAFQKESILQKA